jgi:hypothetical protein
MMVFWAIFSLVVGVGVAVVASLLLGRTERASSGAYNPQALSVIGDLVDVQHRPAAHLRRGPVGDHRLLARREAAGRRPGPGAR